MTGKCLKSTLRLLGVFAHPDDESFGPGGTLAKYASEGADVHVIIATDGIAGSVEEGMELEGHETLAQVRSEELSDAAVALGITSIWSLPYRDSGMRGAPENEHPQALIQQPMDDLVDELTDYMVRLQPHVVITHDPSGGYGHPDHICVCEATTTAFHRLAKSRNAVNGDRYSYPQKLYYSVFDKRVLKLIVRVMPFFGKDPTAFGRNKDINFVEIVGWDTPIHARIDVHAYQQEKLAASMAHASQYGGGPSFMRVLPPPLRQRMMSFDTFTRAFPVPDSVIESDLFAGVELGG